VSRFDIQINERECIIRWEHAFEADPAEKEKFYLTVAIPVSEWSDARRARADLYRP